MFLIGKSSSTVRDHPINDPLSSSSVSFDIRLSFASVSLSAGLYNSAYFRLCKVVISLGPERVVQSKEMSKIWNSLRALEQGKGGAPRKDLDSISDRRCSPRLWVYAPVLVYGHTAGNEPFHEQTEALRVNARGGLITLITAVPPDGPILLMNIANHKEQKCRLVGYRGTYSGRSAIGFEFLESAPGFWDVK